MPQYRMTFYRTAPSHAAWLSNSATVSEHSFTTIEGELALIIFCLPLSKHEVVLLIEWIQNNHKLICGFEDWIGKYTLGSQIIIYVGPAIPDGWAARQMVRVDI